MSSLEIDYSPRILWRLQRGEHVMEARLMPHAQYIAIVILVNGQARAAKAFEHQTEALRLGRKSSDWKRRRHSVTAPLLVPEPRRVAARRPERDVLQN
jgi:hypothetical protein